MWTLPQSKLSWFLKTEISGNGDGLLKLLWLYKVTNWRKFLEVPFSMDLFLTFLRDGTLES